MHGKFTEEVDDTITAPRQHKPQHKRRGEDTQHLLKEDEDLHLVHLAEVFFDLDRV